MMKEVLDSVIPFSIVIPVIIGVVRFKLIQKKYQPFLFLLVIGLVSEILQLIFKSYRFVAPAYARSNIYIVVEYAFYLWFFKNVLNSVKLIRLQILFAVGMIVWLYENFILGAFFNQYDYYFQVGSSLVLTLLAIEGINEVLLKEKKNLLKNGLFLLTAGMVVFYTFNIFLEIEMHFAGIDHKAFFRAIFAIEQCLNCFINLVFALAVLWIPTKKNFTKPLF